MRTIETGKLNEFGNFYQNVDFFNQGKKQLFELITTELLDDVSDIILSNEFWYAEFIFDGKHYLIAADGECTSGGRYVVAELDPRKLEIKSNAEQILKDSYTDYQKEDDDTDLSIEEYCLIEASSVPNFYRWLFDDETVSDFGTNLSDSEITIARDFFKTL